MKTILVLAQHPELAETLRSGLNSEQYRIVHRVNVDEAEPLLVAGARPWNRSELELARRTIRSAFSKPREPSRY